LIHLHRHSEYSFPDGYGTAEAYAKRAKELGQYALALTDHGTLSGIPHHMRACAKEGIFPICGLEAYFRTNRLDHTVENKTAYHLILHAKNLEGWHNLVKLSSEAHRTGFYYKPCIDYTLLEKYSAGLTCTTACVGSYSSQMIVKGDDRELYNYIYRLMGIFGDDLYIALQPHDFQAQRVANLGHLQLAWSLGIPLIVEADAHYVLPEEENTHDIVTMIKTGQTLATRAKKRAEGKDVYENTVKTLYLMDDAEITRHFTEAHPDIPKHVIESAINKTEELVGKFEPWGLDKSSKKPKVVDNQDEAYEIISDWCEDGLERIGRQNDDEYKERLQYELKILKDKEVLDYFVLVGRMVRWAKSNDIRVGIGRGSAAGSLVSFLIGITGIDPIAYGLLFERFLNPGRKAMPDIDLDFQANRREEVKKYLRREYGKDHVADIITHQTFKPRAAIKDVGRVLGIPYGDVEAATNEIPPTFPDPLVKYASENKIIGNFAAKYPEAWEHCLRMENQIRNVGKHAAGIVVTDNPVNDYVPTQRAKGGEIVTSWDDRASYMIIKELGLMKLDILGLTDLEIEDGACNTIEHLTGEKLELHELGAAHNPYDVDPVAMQLFHEGLTLGIFQFNSRGMTGLLKKLKPVSILDLAAANAMYRPGPMDSLPEFIARKNGDKEADYWHESVKPILKDTYGIVAFQEQAMKITQVLGGFSEGEADDFRKAIGNLYREGTATVNKFMQDNGYVDKFINAAADKIGKEAAKEVWDKLIAFGGYGFNLSHSASYALQAYYGAYIKAHYPIAFYASLLTFDPQLAGKATREAKQLGVSIIGPDINISSLGFKAENADTLRFGLKAIKQVGDIAAREIIANAPYNSYEDLCVRTSTRQVNKKVLDALVASGALDRFGMRDGWTPMEKSQAERETLGVSVSSAIEAEKYDAILKPRVWTEEELQEMPEKEPVVVGGEIDVVRQVKTKKGQEMGFIDLVYGDNEYSCTIFPGAWPTAKKVLSTATYVLVKGKTSSRGIIVDKIIDINTVQR
jgi:DNA polymerase III subunit alpha